MKSYVGRISSRLKSRILPVIFLIFFLYLLSYQHSVFEPSVNVSYEELQPQNTNTFRSPKIQYDFHPETTQEKIVREKRRDSVKNGFLHKHNNNLTFKEGKVKL